MKLNMLEKRKLLKKFWIFNGTSGDKADTITDKQVLAIFHKYEEDIYVMIDVTTHDYNTRDKIQTERDQWSDKEWSDYAFEEAD